MPLALSLTGPRDLTLNTYDETPLKPDEVRAQAILSGISHGTELNLYRGTAPFHNKRFDSDRRLFVSAADHTPYPSQLGYDWVGRVIEIGADVANFQVGDLVHLPFAHRETHTFAATAQTALGAIPTLPAALSPERAIMLALAGVALQAVHDAHIKLGDRVAVFGLGVIGLLTVQLARLDGASWVEGIDPLPIRRAAAEAVGADRVLDPTACDVGWEIKSEMPHQAAGVDVAIEISGHYAALQEAIRSVRMGGTVVAAGYYQGQGTALRLGEEWHHNRVTMVSSMGVWNCPHRDYPTWDRGRIHAQAAQLLATQQLKTDGFITHQIPFERAAEAYELIDQRPEETIKVVLTYG